MLKHILKEIKQTTYMNCFICCLDYQQHKITPMLICPMQHHCCHLCADKLFKGKDIAKCPFCNRNIKKNQIYKFRIVEQLGKVETAIQNQQLQIEKQKIQLKTQSQYKYLKSILNLKDSLLICGDNHFKNKNIQEACRTYQQIIQNDLTFDYKINGFGNKNNEKGYYDYNAYEWYEKLKSKIKMNPYDALSLCYSQQVDLYKIGKKQYQMMLLQAPDNYQLLFGLANLECNQKQLKQAKQLYLRVIELKPEFDKADEALALIYYNLGQNQLSLKWAKSTLQKNQQICLLVLYKFKKIKNLLMIKKQKNQKNYFTLIDNIQ